MKRRTFVKGLAASAIAVSVPLVGAESSRYDVIILGAGLAGLNAAYRLTQQGMKVLVLEAQDRVGGRILTASNLPNRPELGGMQIGQTYGYMRTLAAELGINLVPLDGYVRQSDFVVGGQLFNAKEWAGHTANTLSGPEKALPPSALFFHYLRKAPKIDPAFDWNHPRFAQLDISMAKMLKDLGASDEAMRLMNANLNAYNLEGLSAADVLHTLAQRMGSRGPSSRCQGGNAVMPEMLASKLGSTVMTGKVVSSISDSDGVTIRCTDGSAYRAKKCVITLPFSVLKGIEIAGNLSAEKRTAIESLNYTPVTQGHFAVKAPFWEEDGYSPALWSDSPFGRIFASKDKTGEVKYLTSWVNGEAAEKLDKMSDKDAVATIVSSLEKARPAIKGKIELTRYHSWQNQPFSKGAYAHFAPGQVQTLTHVIPKAEGNLHFAGEHTEYNSQGMDAALISGLRIVEELSERL